MTVGSCWPMSRKTKPSSRKSTSRHTAPVCSRLAPEAQLGLLCPMISPATTTASTPETCSGLPEQVGDERRGQRDRVRRQRVAAQLAQRPHAVGDGHARRRPRRPRRARTAPSAAGVEKPSPRAAETATVRMVSAVASLSRPSPWIRVISRGGRPALRPDGQRGHRVGRGDRGAERDPGGQRSRRRRTARSRRRSAARWPARAAPRG